MQVSCFTTIKKPLVVSLFSGVGGLDLGLEAAGFEIAVAIEKDPLTATQYQKNFPNTPVLCANVSQLTGQEIRDRIKEKYPNWDGKISLVCGGPPCQGFSKMGRRDPLDPRNEMVLHFVRLVCELQPQAYLMENVASIEDLRYAPLVTKALARLNEFDYKTTSWPLRAADFGVPQSRERVFWVGMIEGRINSPVPTLRKATVMDAIFGLAKIEPLLRLDSDTIEADVEQTWYVRHLNSTFGTGESPKTLTGCALTKHTAQVIARFSATKPGRTDPVSRFHRLSWNGLAPTLRAGTDSSKGRHTAPRPIHPEFNRVITVREAARLSSFPDWFGFGPTKMQALRQIGNAVPPLLALAVGQQIFFSITQVDSDSKGTAMNATLESTTSFNYKEFGSPRLVQDAIATRSSFLGFCRATLDGLVEQGSKLWDFYEQCVKVLGVEKGKSAFDKWLASDEFGASRYIARSAMEISPWFRNLKPSLQRVIRQKVQNWSVAALKELTRATDEMIQTLIREVKEKLSAKYIKNAIATTGSTDTPTASSDTTNSPSKFRKGGYALVLVDDSRNLKGQVGRLVKKPDEIGRALLKMPSGMEAPFSVEDLKPVRKPRATPAKEETFTRVQVEEMIRREREKAIASYKRQIEEERLGQFVELQQSARTQVESELKAAISRAQKLEQEKRLLQEELNSLREEVTQLSRQSEQVNQLSQRVQDLEKLLDEKNRQPPPVQTITKEAEKVINANVSSTVVALQKQVSWQDAELTELKSVAQNYEIENQNLKNQLKSVKEMWHLSAKTFQDDLEATVSRLGEILSDRFNIGAWSKFGYRSQKGERHTGAEALKVFAIEAEAESIEACY